MAAIGPKSSQVVPEAPAKTDSRAAPRIRQILRMKAAAQHADSDAASSIQYAGSEMKIMWFQGFP